MAVVNLTAQRLRELLSYDSATGEFARLKPGHGSRVGTVQQNKTAFGYIRIRIDNRQYLAHRLAWLHFYGEWPKQIIDHIDGDKANNRIGNLRDVSNAINMQNMKKAKRSNKTSSLLGVSWDRNRLKWKAALVVDRETIALGRFDTEEEAHEAYLSGKRRLHAGCTI